MSEQLSVFHNTVLVGHLTSESFTYSESWVTSGFPIGTEAGLSGPYRAIKKALRLGAEAVE